MFLLQTSKYTGKLKDFPHVDETKERPQRMGRRESPQHIIFSSGHHTINKIYIHKLERLQRIVA